VNVLGIGVDLVSVSRVERMLERHGSRATRRLLSDQEREYCEGRFAPATHVAARLAAKEAAFKALASAGAGSTIGWTEIEVARNDTGTPRLTLQGRAADAAERLGVRSTLVSLTHESSHAAAVVVLIG
jgi:holo-[acyl-carrier protein] synthase